MTPPAVRQPRRTTLRTRGPRTTLRGRTAAHRPATPAAPASRPDRTPDEVPLHEAIRRVMRDMPPVPKQGFNKDDGYYYKQLEDVILTLREVCIRHGVTVIPQQVTKSRGVHDATVWVDVTVTYEITGPDGESKAVQYVGEARSRSDKATQIAMSQCWKYLMSQTFMIPSEEDRDGDAFSPRIPNVRDIKAQGNQRTAAQRRPPAGRSRPDDRQRQGTGQGAPPPGDQRGPGAAAGPLVTAPNAKAIADRLVRAASAPNADAVIPILEEAKQANAPDPEIEALHEIGRAKRAAEHAASAHNGQGGPAGSSPERQAPTTPPGQGHEPTGGHQGNEQRQDHTPGPQNAERTGRPVPAVDAPDQSPQAAARVKAMQFLTECAQAARYPSLAAAARVFKARYGKSLEDAEIHDIEEFAHGMAPDGEPYGEDVPASGETDE